MSYLDFSGTSFDDYKEAELFYWENIIFKQKKDLANEMKELIKCVYSTKDFSRLEDCLYVMADILQIEMPDDAPFWEEKNYG